LRKRYREGQEDQLGALGLVVNIIVLWNTIYMDVVLQQLRKEGYPVRDEDAARLSPTIHKHINMMASTRSSSRNQWPRVNSGHCTILLMISPKP
jgi:Tn3 transposase DDE domain